MGFTYLDALALFPDILPYVIGAQLPHPSRERRSGRG